MVCNWLSSAEACADSRGTKSLESVRPDIVTWKLTNHGEYTTVSTYHTQYKGLPATMFEVIILCNSTPPKCKFFAWPAVKNRLWMADRLMVRVWPDQQTCPLCHSIIETAIYLFTVDLPSVPNTYAISQ